MSITVNSRSPRRASPSRRSRVTPGSSSTSASFCPTSRLNSVDFPTLGRPMMAIVKDINDPNALFRRACQSNEKKKSTRERTARHRRRERGLLRGLRRRGRLIGRRRGGALARDLGRLGRRRRGGGAAFLLGCGVGRPQRRGRRPACPWISRHASISVLPPAAEPRRQPARSGRQPAADGRPCRDPSARPARGPARLRGIPACGHRAASSWYRGSRADRTGRNCRAALPQPASAPESAMRTAVAIKRCGRRILGFPLNSFCRSALWRPAAARPAALRHASAGSAAFRRHWRSNPAIAASPQHRWRARPTAPAIRARYGER